MAGWYLDPNDPRRKLKFCAERTSDGWKAYCAKEDEIPHKVLIAAYSASTEILTTYPVCTLQTTTKSLFEAQYEQMQAISLQMSVLKNAVSEHYEFENYDELSFDEFTGDDYQTESPLWTLGRLPDGFRRDFRFGLGLMQELRELIFTIEASSSCSELRLVASDEWEITNSLCSMPASTFAEAWAETKRISQRATSASRRVRDAYLHNVLAPHLGFGLRKYSLGRHPTSVVLTKAAAEEYELTDVEQADLLAAIQTSGKVVASSRPDQFGMVRQELEVAGLNALIGHLETELFKSHQESYWQSFFQKHTFSLRQALGTPALIVASQANVGGAGFFGAGNKYADFLVKNPLTQNVALVEIKKPETNLIGKPYRSTKAKYGTVFAPHKELVGATVQVLDQRDRLKSRFAQLKDDSGQHDLRAWAISCYVIAGRVGDLSPDELRSFELYRGNLHGVRVVTYDEVLDQLRSLRDFLSEASGKA